MTNEEMNKIQAIIKKIFLVSTAVYALFVFCIIFFLRNILTPMQLITIIIFTPMIIGVVILLIYKVKHPPVLDESDDVAEEELIEQPETED